MDANQLEELLADLELEREERALEPLEYERRQRRAEDEVGEE